MTQKFNSNEEIEDLAIQIVNRHIHLHGGVDVTLLVTFALEDSTTQPSLFSDYPWQVSARIHVAELQQFNADNVMSDRDLIPLADPISVCFDYLPVQRDEPVTHLSTPVVRSTERAGWSASLSGIGAGRWSVEPTLKEPEVSGFYETA